jgi:hypothetical protein
MATPAQTYAYTAARALGLRTDGDPVETIALHCEERVLGVAREYGCTTLDALRAATGNKLRTRVVIITSDDELAELQATYVARQEPGFIGLHTDLSPSVYGQTMRLITPRKHELPFVSVIDARGEKVARAEFTEWHEYAHLLTLTDPTLASFRRSHADLKPPEEQLMDTIAGRVAFLRPLFAPHLPPALTLASIAATRAAACPRASWSSLFIALSRAWVTPVIYVHAEVNLKKAQKAPPGQASFGFTPEPVGQLRAVHAIQNSAARQAGFFLPPNMRVPLTSAIMEAHESGQSTERPEDLGLWESRQSGHLADWPVYVIARPTAGGVDALLVSTESA